MPHEELQPVFGTKIIAGCGSSGGGLVVSVLSCYSDDPSSNPAESYCLFCNMLLNRAKINKKRGRGLGPLKLSQEVQPTYLMPKLF